MGGWGGGGCVAYPLFGPAVLHNAFDDPFDELPVPRHHFGVRGAHLPIADEAQHIAPAGLLEHGIRGPTDECSLAQDLRREVGCSRGRGRGGNCRGRDGRNGMSDREKRGPSAACGWQSREVPEGGGWEVGGGGVLYTKMAPQEFPNGVNFIFPTMVTLVWGGGSRGG